jgi:hypothetical protein
VKGKIWYFGPPELRALNDRARVMRQEFCNGLKDVKLPGCEEDRVSADLVSIVSLPNLAAQKLQEGEKKELYRALGAPLLRRVSESVAEMRARRQAGSGAPPRQLRAPLLREPAWELNRTVFVRNFIEPLAHLGTAVHHFGGTVDMALTADAAAGLAPPPAGRALSLALAGGHQQPPRRPLAGHEHMLDGARISRMHGRIQEFLELLWHHRRRLWGATPMRRALHAQTLAVAEMRKFEAAQRTQSEDVDQYEKLQKALEKSKKEVLEAAQRPSAVVLLFMDMLNKPLRNPAAWDATSNVALVGELAVAIKNFVQRNASPDLDERERLRGQLAEACEALQQQAEDRVVH